MIQILRLSHRLPRDCRTTTHIALASRALGASKTYYSGQKDSSLETSIKKTTKTWGGNFSITYIKNPLALIKKLKKQNYKIIHLSMYSIPIQKIIPKIRKHKKLLIIIGSERVPIEYYKISDFNVAISNQPHSEISSLSLFLHEYFQGKELNLKFKNPKLKILPQEKGKKLKQ